MTAGPRAVVEQALRDWALLYPIPAWGLAHGDDAERLAAAWASSATKDVFTALKDAGLGTTTSARAGYGQAVVTLLDVAERTGSPAARWAADYLAEDPDERGPG